MAKSISPDIKAAALADLASGEQPAVVAERYKLSSATVRKWKERYAPEPDVTPLVTRDSSGVTPLRRPTIEAQQHRIGVAVLDLLEAKLRASEALAKIAHDADWRAKQTGSDVAALGMWLDQTAFAIGDRLARRTGDDGDDA